MTHDEFLEITNSPEYKLLNEIVPYDTHYENWFTTTDERDLEHALRLARSYVAVLEKYPELPETYKQRLYNALYKVRLAKGDVQRREAETEFNNILGDVSQKQESLLQYELGLPSTQLNNLVAAGYSPTGARGVISGQPYAPAVTEPNSVTAPDVLSQSIQGVTGVVSSVVSIFSLGASLAKLGADLQVVDAQAKAAAAGADIASYQKEGLDTAQKFNEVCAAARNTKEYSDDINSISDYLKLIEDLGSDGDDTIFYDFMQNYVRNGKMSNPFALQYCKSQTELLLDNNAYATRLANELRLQNLDIQGAEAELDNTREEFVNIVLEGFKRSVDIEYSLSYEYPIAEQTLTNLKKQGKKIDADIVGQNIANRAARYAADYAAKVIPKQAELDFEKLQMDLAVLNGLKGQGDWSASCVVDQMLQDAKSRQNFAILSSLISSDQLDYYKNNPKLREFIKEFQSDYVKQAFENYLLQQDAGNKTVTTGETNTYGNFGNWSNTKTERLDCASYVLYNQEQSENSGWFSRTWDYLKYGTKGRPGQTQR